MKRREFIKIRRTVESVRPPFTPGDWQGIVSSSALGGFIQIVAVDGPTNQVVAEINTDGPLTPEHKANARGITNAVRLYDIAHELARVVCALVESAPGKAAEAGAHDALEQATAVLCDVQFGELVEADGMIDDEITVEERAAQSEGSRLTNDEARQV
jgi:hypothetical protein